MESYSINDGLLSLPCGSEGFPGGSAGKESTCNAGDLGLIRGLERSPRRRERLPTAVFWPGELVHGVAKCRTQLSNFHFHFLYEHQGKECGLY